MNDHIPESDFSLPADPLAVSSKLQEVMRQQATVDNVADVVASCSPHQRAVLGVLGVAHRHQFETAGLLKQLAIEVPKRYRGLMEQVAAEIDNGSSVTDAIASAPGLLPTQVVVLLQLAEDNNSLDVFYDRLLDRPGEAANIPFSERQQMLWKLLRKGCVYLVGFVVFCFIGIKIVPELYDIVEEYEIAEPHGLAILDVMCRWFILPLGLVMLVSILLSPILLNYLVGALRGWNLHSWKTQQISTGSRQQKVLAFQVRAQKEQVDAVKHLVSPSEYQAISSAGSHDTQSWLLDYCVGKNETRGQTRSIRILQVVLGIANILFGLFVFAVAVSVFLTSIEIIEKLSQW